MKKLILINPFNVITTQASDFTEFAEKLRKKFTKEGNILVSVTTSWDSDLVKYGYELSKHNFSYKYENNPSDEKSLDFIKRISERSKEYDYVLVLTHYKIAEFLEILEVIQSSCDHVCDLKELKKFGYYLEFKNFKTELVQRSSIV